MTEMGTMGLAGNEKGITAVYLPGEMAPMNGVEEETPLLKETAKQIKEYLSGKRKGFTVPLALEGTEFSRQVWEALRKIPYGQTRSYGEVAAMIGRPGAARAVGQANNRNPLSIMIPCHRVIGADGKLVGFVAGLKIKQQLLELEKRHARS
ncbi:MAG: methylated-DNA--[protein]-cysteine S-methyltransferase [Methanomassiliicoccales archaeon]|nr:methylated-DNA--[protein]-cysteine S-methyltransferase [Methanomassiliicoccales archaeon]